MSNRANIFRLVFVVIYCGFVGVSVWVDFPPGKQIGMNLVQFFLEMLKVLPCAFILVGLFEVWIKSETVEKHFGQQSGLLGYAWITLLAGTTIGGLYVAFPIAYSLYNKGAKMGIILTYLGASAVCRIPMTIFEASFLGLKFSLIRLGVSIPLVILTSMWLGRYLERSGYQVPEKAPGKRP